MGNWFSDFFEETGEFLSENAGDILTLGGAAMGIPPETLAIAKTVLGAMGKKNTSAADKTSALIQSGIDAQTAYQLAALDEVKSSGQRSTAIATADKQMAYDINRGQFASNQQNILPYQMASLSALQALPQLQQLLGVNAYALPTSISQYAPPQVDFADTYAKTQEQLFPTATPTTQGQTVMPANPSGVGEVGSGLRINQPNTSSSGFMGQNTAGLGAPEGLYEEFVAKTGRAPTGEMELYGWRSAGKPANYTFNAGQSSQDIQVIRDLGRSMDIPQLPGDNRAEILKGIQPAMAGYASGASGSMRPEEDAFQRNLAGGGQSQSATGGTTTQSLTPYTGDAYDLNNSPLYKWQKQQMEEGLRNQLAASGLSGGTYAQRELARNEQSLAAQERERVVGNLQSLTSLGMQGAGLGQSSFSLPQSTDLLNAGSSQASQIADIYGNLGNIAGTGAMQLAQNNTAAANAANKGTSVWQDLYEMGSSQGWWGNKSSKSSSSNPYTTALGYTLPGEFDFKSW